MDSESVLEAISILEAAKLFACVDGGWGVDALLGAQTRDHRDLDLIVNALEVMKVKDALGAVGYRDQEDGTAANFVLKNYDGRTIDVHALRFDEKGFGCFSIPEGGEWPFPPKAFEGGGQIGGRPVRCLSVYAQVQCHGQGYQPSDKDWHDMSRLQEQFGVVLPLHFYRG